MSKEPELIVNTVIDPAKWEEALELLREVVANKYEDESYFIRGRIEDFLAEVSE